VSHRGYANISGHLTLHVVGGLLIKLSHLLKLSLKAIAGRAAVNTLHGALQSRVRRKWLLHHLSGSLMTDKTKLGFAARCGRELWLALELCVGW